MWFNDVDATHKADLKELNELNFARFDAKLEQRLAQMDVRWERRFAELESKLGETKNELLRWIIGLFASTGLAMLGLGVALITIILKR